MEDTRNHEVAALREKVRELEAKLVKVQTPQATVCTFLDSLIGRTITKRLGDLTDGVRKVLEAKTLEEAHEVARELGVER